MLAHQHIVRRLTSAEILGQLLPACRLLLLFFVTVPALADIRADILHNAQQLGQWPQGTQIDVKLLGNPPDPSDCPHAWTMQLQGNERWQGRLNIHLICPDNPHTRWLSVLINVHAPVVIVRQTVRHGDSIVASALTQESRDITWTQAYFTDPAKVIGAVARRDLLIGSMIIPSDLSPPLLVRRGEQVLLRADHAGITVNDVGTALNDASRGEAVRVRHSRSGHVVEGIAVDQDIVALPL